MKLKHVIILAGVFLFNSCIVKSLNPFYTQDKVVLNAGLEGNWESKDGFWEITTFTDMWKEYQKGEETSQEDKAIYERFRNSYIVRYNQNSKKNNSLKKVVLKESEFIATAFEVNGHTFLDFFPIEYNTDGINNLVSQHLLSTHSVCLAEFKEDNSLQLKWLDEDVVGRLIKNHNLKIKYEKIGYDDDFVLTAKSKELYRFLQKFMKSNIENKWEKDQIYTLAPLNEE
jgi:hypothetical protein